MGVFPELFEMPNNSKTVVLIADDEPSTVAMLSSHLRSKGYSVLEANDGDEAWELAHEHLPHLVVLDVMMPGMSGWEVCRKIREAVSLAHTGVVMLTGIGESLNEMTSPLYGADAHVDKPFEFAVLDRKIKETLLRRKQGALGRPDRADDESASFAIDDDDLPTLPPSAPKKAARAQLAKPLAKTKPQLQVTSEAHATSKLAMPTAKSAPTKVAAKTEKAAKKLPNKGLAEQAPATPVASSKKASPKPGPAPKKKSGKPAAPATSKPRPAKAAPAAKKTAPAAKKTAPAAKKTAPAAKKTAPAAKKAGVFKKGAAKKGAAKKTKASLASKVAKAMPQKASKKGAARAVKPSKPAKSPAKKARGGVAKPAAKQSRAKRAAKKK